MPSQFRRSIKSSEPEKTYFIENLGCVKNQVDAEIMISALQRTGWNRALNSDDAEVIIVNSCGFIIPAKEESIEVTLDFRKRYPEKKIILAGCFSQRYGREVKSALPEVDGIFGNHAPERIVEMINEVGEAPPMVLIPDQRGGEVNRSQLLSYPGSAYIKISEGCNHRCTFCAIPLIRGNLHSRTVDSVVNEIRGLLERGVFEFNLIAQDLASFGTDREGEDFLSLLMEISRLEGDFWIRLLYIHPDNFPLEIFDLIENDKRILPYFDIPFQHASEGLLRRMGRRGNYDTYINLVKEIRGKVPDSVIRSTFMVGFPGEKAADIKILEQFLREAQIDWAGFFIYSREEGTKSYAMKSTLSQRFFHSRVESWKTSLEQLQQGVTEKMLDRFVGHELTMIIEEAVEGEDLFLGRAYMQAPEVDGLIVIHGDDFTPGDRIPCRIIKQNGLDFEAISLL